MTSAIKRNFSAIAAAGAGVGVIGLIVAAGYEVWAANQVRIVDALATHDRLAAIAAYGQVLDRQPKADTAELFDAIYLGDGQPAVLSANLLTLLERLAVNQGLAVTRENALPPKQDGAITRVGGAIAIAGSLPAIYGFLQQIEAAKPVLIIDRLDIRVSPTGLPEEQSETIASAEVEVSGIIRSQAQPPGDGT